VPQAWIDGAKKEGTLLARLNLSDKNFQTLYKVFADRYPFIKIEYTRGVGVDRAVKPLLAFKSGRYITDVVSGFTAKYHDYTSANALESLENLPTWKNVPEELRDPKGGFTSYEVVNWCTSYNVNKVKKEDLPKTWEELLTDPKWRGGRVGVGNRPQLWLAMLWTQKGAGWTTDYMNKLFTEVKPQLRKEAINGLMKLASIGEFDLAIPSAGYRVKIQVKRGAPIAFHCPEPVPTSSSPVGIFKGAPHINGARVFVNWLLSKEGQLALFRATGAQPSHIGLQTLDGASPYPDAVKGKKHAYRTLKTLIEDMGPMYKAWNKAWAESGGPQAKRAR
jgi:ABC-type Fe3+ transport system substrate-binding protein